MRENEVQLLVPSLVVEKFERNRERIEPSMTSSIKQLFKLMKQNLVDYGTSDMQDAADIVADLTRDVPLIGEMTTRNFDDVLALLRGGKTVEPTHREQEAAVVRRLEKRAPLHRQPNSFADALLIELYTPVSSKAELSTDPHTFVTSNSDDFSEAAGDKRKSHVDIAELFDTEGSAYALGVDGLNAILLAHFGEEIPELFTDMDFVEEPRRLGEITDAEKELVDRIWHHRSQQADYRYQAAGDRAELERERTIAGPGRKRVEETYTQPGQLGPYTNFELGMLNGKLSAQRWVLGSEWDFLDTQEDANKVTEYRSGHEPRFWEPDSGVISHRFTLGTTARSSACAPPLIAIGMNLSHATETQADRTVNRLIEASVRHGYSGGVMLNRYPVYSPKSSKLTDYSPALSELNCAAIEQVLVNHSATEGLGAWGNIPQSP